MPIILEYLLKVSITLAVVYLFYQLLLRRLTFYNWNRWYLLGYSLLAFVIPFLNITDFLFKHELQQNNFVQWIPAVTTLQLNPQGIVWDVWATALLVFSSGVLLTGIRVVLQLISLHKIKNKATLLNSDDVKLYHVHESIVPFSFNNAIYVNSELHTEAELQEIIRHEFVHVKQKHSIDILLAELLCIILWFNPVAWFIRKSIRQNLEFIADHKVLDDGLDKKQYQYLLLKVVGNNRYSITPKFNFSSLKNRIAMMNKMKSARVQILRFLFVLPLIAVLLLAFREVKRQELKSEFSQATVLKIDSVPHPAANNIITIDITKNKGTNNVKIVLKDGTVENYNLDDAVQKAALEKKYGKIIQSPPLPSAQPSTEKWTLAANKDIETVDVTKENGKNSIRIRLKNGTVETYDLNDPKQKEILEKKYGASMTIPPPPPPPPLETLTIISTAKEQFIPNEKGYYLSIADNHGECIVIVKDKDKKIVEAFTLTDWNKKETIYKNRYGDIPPPPPPTAPSMVSVVAPVSIATTVSPVSKLTGTIAPTVAIHVVKSNVAVVSEISTLAPVTATVQVAPVSVESKLTVATSPVMVEQKTGAPKLQLNVSGVNGFPTGALYYIDGKEASYEDIEKLNPDFIESISILKGESATKAYGEKAKNGVILIKTKIKTAKRNLQIYDKVNTEPDK